MSQTETGWVKGDGNGYEAQTLREEEARFKSREKKSNGRRKYVCARFFTQAYLYWC